MKVSQGFRHAISPIAISRVAETLTTSSAHASTFGPIVRPVFKAVWLIRLTVVLNEKEFPGQNTNQGTPNMTPLLILHNGSIQGSLKQQIAKKMSGSGRAGDTGW